MITASTNCDLWAERRKTPSDEDDKWTTDLSNPALYSLESQAGLVAINFYSIWGQTLRDWVPWFPLLSKPTHATCAL